MKKRENKEKKYNIYQFFKYHSLGPFTQINVQPMFYENLMRSNKGIEFIKYYKENSFITGFSLSMCFQKFLMINIQLILKMFKK